jgi:hypothetical protein
MLKNKTGVVTTQKYCKQETDGRPPPSPPPPHQRRHYACALSPSCLRAFTRSLLPRPLNRFPKPNGLLRRRSPPPLRLLRPRCCYRLDRNKCWLRPRRIIERFQIVPAKEKNIRGRRRTEDGGRRLLNQQPDAQGKNRIDSTPRERNNAAAGASKNKYLNRREIEGEFSVYMRSSGGRLHGAFWMAF